MSIWDEIQLWIALKNCQPRIIYQSNNIDIGAGEAVIGGLKFSLGKLTYKTDLLQQASDQLKQIDDTDLRLCKLIKELEIRAKDPALLNDLYRFRAAIIVNNDNVCNSLSAYKLNPEKQEKALNETLEMSKELTHQMLDKVLNPIKESTRHKGVMGIGVDKLDVVKMTVSKSYDVNSDFDEESVNDFLEKLRKVS